MRRPGRITGGVVLLSCLLVAGPGWSEARRCWNGWGGCDCLDITIPETLPATGVESWLQCLEKILRSELAALDAYRIDMRRFRIHMPYGRVIPQKEKHIEWIRRLLVAYGVGGDILVPAAAGAPTPRQAIIDARDRERELALEAEQLGKTAPDETAAKTMLAIAAETRIHSLLFDFLLCEAVNFIDRLADRLSNTVSWAPAGPPHRPGGAGDGDAGIQALGADERP